MLVFDYYYCVIALCGGQGDKKLAYNACANSSTMTPTTITSVVTPTPEASTSTTDINSAIITTAEIHHQKEVCEDYTVSNISRITRSII